MFCGKCGTQNDDNAVFCGGCGAKLNNASTATPSSVVKTSPATSIGSQNANAPFKKIGVFVIVAVAAIALLLFLFGGGGSGSSSPEDAVIKFMDGIFENDADELLACMPENLLEDAYKKNDLTEKEAVKQLSEMLSQLHKSMDALAGGKKWNVSYKAKEVKDLSADTYKNLVGKYVSNYNVKISDAKEVSLELTVKYDSFNNTNTTKMYVVEIDGVWYIDVFSVDNIF